MNNAGLPAFRDGAPSTADRSGTVVHMQGALIKILLSSGLVATPENDTTNPDHVLVFGTTSGPPSALRPAFTPESP